MLSDRTVLPRIRTVAIGGLLAASAVLAVPGTAFGVDLSRSDPWGQTDNPWDQPDDPWGDCFLQVYCERDVNILDGKDSGKVPKKTPYQERTWKYEHTDEQGHAWYRNTAKGKENVWKSTPDVIPYTKLWWVRTSESIIDAARAGDR